MEGGTLGLVKDLVHRSADAPFRIKNGNVIEVGAESKVVYRRVRARPGCHVKLGDKSLLQANVFFDRSDATLAVGNRTFIGKSMIIVADRVDVGDDVLISWG